MASNVTARDAVKIASEYYQFITGNYTTHFIAEEVSRNALNDHWLITLSVGDQYDALFNKNKKEYKIFEIDSKSGEVLSMKMKESA
jgi:hypothetical protein